MIRGALFILALAGIYLIAKSTRNQTGPRQEDHAADAQWANEGGGNSPATV
jgi:hypothetical protein